MKFGGTSVGSAQRFAGVARIIANCATQGEQVVVVVSAMSKTTDLLIAAARHSAMGDTSEYERCRDLIVEKHRTTIAELFADETRRARLEAELRPIVEGFEKLCYGISIIGELSGRALDCVAGTGERLSVRILAAKLREDGLKAHALDTSDFVITDSEYGDAQPNLDLTRAAVHQQIIPLLERGEIPVVTGMIGATVKGIPTTFGRGGSDYSATILASAVDAEEVWIWTDVDGVMTADPDLVPAARTLPEISYSEAAELSYYGAKVLHPKTLLPVLEKKIPVWIKNAMNVAAPGTKIHIGGGGREGVKAITSIKNISLININGRGMFGVPGIAGRTFSAMAQQKVNVLMISQSSSENNICFAVLTEDAEQAVEALREALVIELHHRHVEEIQAQSRVAIIAAVGARMKGIPGISARVFGALGKQRINVIAIAQGSSELNISCIIDEQDVPAAVAAIHEEFHLE